MTIANDDIPESDLHAFIDGELDAGRAREIAVRLAASPALAERVAQFRADKASIGRFYGPLIDQPVPEKLLRLARSSAQREAGRVRSWAAPAGALAAAAALIVATWIAVPLLSPHPTDALVAEALAVRGDKRTPQQEFAGGALPYPENLKQITATSLGVPVKAPDLKRAGFELARVGVYATGTELSYRDARGRVFTVYLHRATGRDQFELREQGTSRICIWQNDDLSAVMIGEMSSSEMLRVASLTYTDLNF